MEFNKLEYVEALKKEFGNFDNDFFVKEDENGEIVTVVIIGKSVKSIEIICKCPTIKQLILRDNKIEDLTPLYNLSSIISLDISNNRLTSLFGIASNKNIEQLNAGNNKISEMMSMFVGKELYEKEFKGKPIGYVSEYFSKPKDIVLNGQEEIQAFIRQHSV